MQRARSSHTTRLPSSGHFDRQLHRTQLQLLEVELRIKRAEAQIKESAARRAEDERWHQERMRYLECSTARRS